MLSWESLTLFLYIVARISGFVLFNPLLNRSNFPGIFRAGLILVLSVFTFSITEQAVIIPTRIISFLIRILMELMVGFVLGMVVHFFFYIPQLAGQAIDTQMGMTMNQIYDAGAQANLSVTAIFLNVLMTLLFFATNGHHTLLKIIITSGVGIPFGEVSIDVPLMVRASLELFVECTILAVKLCLPILVAELLGQLGMGILMKVIPQINVFSINIELKVLIGLLMMLFLISPFSEFFLQIEVTMLKRVEAMLRLLAT